MGRADAALSLQTRCLLAVRGVDGPLVGSVAFWFDGTSIWCSTAAAGGRIERLRKDPVCALWVPPVSEHGPQGVAISGRARVFSAADPLGFAFHALTISAAMTALAARNAGNVVGYAQDITGIPARLRLQEHVVLRISVERMRGLVPPDAGPGVAPPLPTVVPPDVRRALTGRRDVLLVADGGEGFTVGPVAWGAGFAIQLPEGLRPPTDVPAALVLDDHTSQTPGSIGLALQGTLVKGPQLRVQRVTWWRGATLETADVATAAPGAIVLPP